MIGWRALILLVGTLPPALASDPYESTVPGLPGSSEAAPALGATGSATPDSRLTLELEGALPGTFVAAILGFSELAVPFKGGVLGPSADWVFPFAVPDRDGRAAQSYRVPAATPPGAEFWVQMWMRDPVGPVGLAASNGLHVIVQPPTLAHLLFPGAKYTSGSVSVSVAVGDLDLDGELDLVVANLEAFEAEGLADLMVLKGAGDASFSLAGKYEVGDRSSGVALGEFVGDGAPDLVVANRDSNDVAVLHNLGGTFQQVFSVAVGSTPFHVAVADFDGDGDDDFATANLADDTVTVALRDPAAAEGWLLSTHAVGDAPRWVHPVDISGDGALDLAVACQGSAQPGLALLENLGGGAFGNLQVLPTQGSGASSVASRPSGEGTKVEFAVANRLSGTVALIRFDPATLTVEHELLEGAEAPIAVLYEDVTQDGLLDVLAVDAQGDEVLVWPGLEGGGHGLPFEFLVSESPRAAVVADLDGDGARDLAVACAQFLPGELTILRGSAREGSAVPFAGASHHPTGSQPESLVTADFDGDGHADFATGNVVGTDVTLAFGDGTGGFGPPIALLMGERPVSLLAADFDLDGAPDLAAGGRVFEGLFVRLGDGAGGFGPVASSPGGDSPRALASADVNGDGLPDLVSANFSSQDVSIHLGAGGGSFEPGFSVPIGAPPTDVVLGDFDGNGLCDLAVPLELENQIAVSLASAPATYGAWTHYPGGLGPRALATGDLDGDGHLDLAFAIRVGSGLGILLGAGDGTFPGSAGFHPTEQGPTKVVLEDIDVDGRLDAVLIAGGVAVLPGEGDGTFQAPVRFAAGQFMTELAVAFINADARLDALALDTASDVVAVLLNQH